MSSPLAIIEKDPQANKPYTIGFKKYLDTGDILFSVVWTVPVGLTRGTETLVEGGTRARIWLSGGTAGQEYEVKCHIVTVGGLEDDFTLLFQMVEG